MVNRGVNFGSTRRIFNSKTNNGGLFHLCVKRKAVCAYKNLTNFESCPVQLYKKYLSHVPTEIYIVINFGNRTEWSPIRSVIILVINKSDSRFAVVRFC